MLTLWSCKIVIKLNVTSKVIEYHEITLMFKSILINITLFVLNKIKQKLLENDISNYILIENFCPF